MKIFSKVKKLNLLIISLVLAAGAISYGQITDSLPKVEPAGPNPAPPTQVKARDTRNDAGKSITVEWTLSAIDVEDVAVLKGYEIYRSEKPDTMFENIGFALCGKTSYDDNTTRMEKNTIIMSEPFHRPVMLIRKLSVRPAPNRSGSTPTGPIYLFWQSFLAF